MINQLLLEYIQSMIANNIDSDQILGTLYHVLASHYGSVNHANDNLNHVVIPEEPKDDIVKIYEQAHKAIVSQVTSAKE